MRFQGYALVRWPLSGSNAYSTAWSRAHYVGVVKGELIPTTVCHVEVNPGAERVFDVPTPEVCKNCLK